MELTTTTGADAAAEAALSCARAAGGRDVALAPDGAPQVAAAGFGPGAYTCRLAGELPPLWDGPLVVRVGAAADLARERDWHAFCDAQGVPVPAVLGLSGGALVLARGPSSTLMESLGENPTAIPALLRSMAEVHARLHQVPAAAAPGATTPTPLAGLDLALAATADPVAGAGAVARTGGSAGAARGSGAGPGAAAVADRFAAERAWLHDNAPPAGPPVVCHGDVQPSSVRLDAGDVASAQLVDWSHARVGEAEYDVALTLLMFWSAPYLAEGIGQRKMLKTVRDMITDGYRSAYESSPGSGPLDDRRLRYWGAFHALAWSVRLAVAEAAGGPADPWDPVALVQHVGSYRKDLGRRFARLTRG